MSKSFVALIEHHIAMIGKKVSVVSKDTVASGVLKSVSQVVYGIKPTYHLVLDDQSVLSLSGILVPYHGTEIDEQVVELYLFEPYTR